MDSRENKCLSTSSQCPQLIHLLPDGVADRVIIARRNLRKRGVAASAAVHGVDCDRPTSRLRACALLRARTPSGPFPQPLTQSTWNAASRKLTLNTGSRVRLRNEKCKTLVTLQIPKAAASRRSGGGGGAAYMPGNLKPCVWQDLTRGPSLRLVKHLCLHRPTFQK